MWSRRSAGPRERLRSGLVYYVAGFMYDVGIQAQQGIVKVLEADDAKLAQAAQKLADKITKAVKEALKIKSPSQVFRDEVGLMLTAGLDKGQPSVDTRLSTLVNPGSVNSVDKADLTNSLTGQDLAGGEQIIVIQNHLSVDGRTWAEGTKKGINERARNGDPVPVKVGGRR